MRIAPECLVSCGSGICMPRVARAHTWHQGRVSVLAQSASLIEPRTPCIRMRRCKPLLEIPDSLQLSAAACGRLPQGQPVSLQPQRTRLHLREEFSDAHPASWCSALCHPRSSLAMQIHHQPLDSVAVRRSHVQSIILCQKRSHADYPMTDPSLNCRRDVRAGYDTGDCLAEQDGGGS